MDRDQALLLLDALVLGPYMMHTAREIKSPYFRRGMKLAGVAAIVVAGAAWLRAFNEKGFIGERIQPNNGDGLGRRAPRRAIRNPARYCQIGRRRD